MVLRFAGVELDLRAGELRRDGVPVATEPQVFALIALLAERPGALVSYDEIHRAIWGGRIVSDAALASRLAAARRALGDDGQRQAVIETVPRRGLRLRAEPEKAYDGSGTQGVRFARSHDGTRIAFATTGAGPGLLRAGHFLTHLELDWQSPVWRPLLERLGSSFRVTRYDQRGTGLSDPDPPTRDIDALTDDLEAVADAAGLTRFPIFAASQGVPVSLSFVARRPARVTALVLYGGFVRGAELRTGGAGAARSEAMRTLIREGWGRAGSAFATAFAALYMPDADAAQLAAMTRMQLASSGGESAVALRAAIDRIDVSGLLADVRAPCLVIHAREDGVQPLSEARDLAAGLPGAGLRVLDSRNHVPLPQDPAWEELVSESVRFLLGQHEGTARRD